MDYKSVLRSFYHYQRKLLKRYWVESLVLTLVFSLLAATANPIRLGVAFLLYINLAPMVRLKDEILRDEDEPDKSLRDPTDGDEL